MRLYASSAQPSLWRPNRPLSVHMYTHSVALDRAIIAAAGRRVVADSEWAKLSIRSVASPLGVSPMALYRHVADSADLARIVLDAIVERCPELRDGDDLASQLAVWARRLRDVLHQHPGSAGWLLTHWFECGPMLERIEALLALVDGHGVHGVEAVAATNALFTYVLMRCEAERQVRSAGVVRRQLKTSEVPRPLPHLRALAGHYATAEFDAHFEYGLQALLRGTAIATEVLR